MTSAVCLLRADLEAELDVWAGVIPADDTVWMEDVCCCEPLLPFVDTLLWLARDDWQ